MQTTEVTLSHIVADLAAEGDELYAVLKDMDTGFWTEVSSFKAWTVWDVVAHLHMADKMALASLQGESEFHRFMHTLGSGNLREVADKWLKQGRDHSPTGPEMLTIWRETFVALCTALGNADPEARYTWVGPSMKAKMMATARLMETWAHGWEVYDLMKLPRQQHERLHHIATIGIRTFAWTFNNRSLPVPEPQPYVELTSPGGDLWQWNERDPANMVRGSANDFCQVVTQVRNVADTELEVVGDIAQAWMQIAQCFAGPPEDPPAPGTRVPAPELP